MVRRWGPRAASGLAIGGRAWRDGVVELFEYLDTQKPVPA